MLDTHASVYYYYLRNIYYFMLHIYTTHHMHIGTTRPNSF